MNLMSGSGRYIVIIMEYAQICNNKRRALFSQTKGMWIISAPTCPTLSSMLLQLSYSAQICLNTCHQLSSMHNIMSINSSNYAGYNNYVTSLLQGGIDSHGFSVLLTIAFQGQLCCWISACIRTRDTCAGGVAHLIIILTHHQSVGSPPSPPTPCYTHGK